VRSNRDEGDKWDFVLNLNILFLNYPLHPLYPCRYDFASHRPTDINLSKVDNQDNFKIIQKRPATKTQQASQAEK
jgi:hypothetical protein